jgi:hypothetical protein
MKDSRPPLPIALCYRRKQDGELCFGRFVSAVVGINLCPDAGAGAGFLDTTIFLLSPEPDMLITCSIVRMLHQRHCIRGRATQVFEISVPNSTVENQEHWPLGPQNPKCFKKSRALDANLSLANGDIFGTANLRTLPNLIRKVRVLYPT